MAVVDCVSMQLCNLAKIPKDWSISEKSWKTFLFGFRARSQMRSSAEPSLSVCGVRWRHGGWGPAGSMSMPRSLAGDRSSLSRGSVLTSRSDAISVGSAVTRHWVNSVSDIYGPDEIEELLEDLNRLEMASFDGVMIDYDGVRPTSSEMNIMQNEAVISGCITQGPPEEHDVEDFDIDGSQVKYFFYLQDFLDTFQMVIFYR